MGTMTDEVLARLLEKVEQRFYGKYRAFVSDNADPENLGRLKLTIPSVLGANVVSGWAMPCTPYGGCKDRGFFFIPEKQDGVWVEFEGGLLEFPVWVGMFWCKAGGSSEAPPPGVSQSPPTSKIIKTAAHTIELADEQGKETIRIADSNNNKLTIDKDGILIDDGNGNEIKMASGGITIKSSLIKVGANASSEKLVKGTSLVQLLTTWQTLLAAHFHPNGNMGAPTAPAATLASLQTPDSSLLSSHKVE
jgi:hypothetical protein